MRSTSTAGDHGRAVDLRAAIHRTGYYPEVVADGVDAAIAREEVVSFSISGPLPEMLADRAYRIPPLSLQDAADMVREIKSSPLLFGYRGSEVVDVEEVERLILRVSRLQHGLPQVRSLSLSLIQVGAQGAAVLSAAVRIEPVLDPRSDWFVRRLATAPGDTIPD